MKEDICSILQCAGLIHDIGNPPFGHFGESAIREWFERNLQESIWKEYGLTERIREGLPPYNRQRLISEAARQDAGLSVGQKRFYQDAADPLAGGILVCEVIGPEHRGKYIGI